MSWLCTNCDDKYVLGLSRSIVHVTPAGWAYTFKTDKGVKFTCFFCDLNCLGEWMLRENHISSGMG